MDHHDQSSTNKLTDAALEALPPFEYAALSEPDNTRLLYLHPGSDDEAIECSLYEITLNLEEYHYYALSYAWGDPQPMHNISCNGHKMKITRNLYSVLNRLRLKDKERMLWVDALCINQGHETAALQERAQQVAMMHVVYASAVAVFTDLGEDDINTEYLLYNLDYFLAQSSEEWAKPLAEWSDAQTKITFPKIKGLFWSVLARFLDRPWSQRLWMFQEFVLAKKIIFLLGTRHIYEGVIERQILPACELYLHIVEHNHGLEIQTIGMTREHLHQVFIRVSMALRHREHIRISYQASLSQVLTLSRLIHGTQWLSVTNAQDRVYALLSIIKSVAARQFAISYLESPSDTAIRASLLIANQDPLYLLYRGAGIDSLQPSWTLTLQHRENIALESCWEPGGLNKLFQACGCTEASMTVDHAALSLIVKSARIGKVAYMSHILTFETSSSMKLNDLDVLCEYFKMADWIKARRVSGSSCFTEEDFWRTLVADMIVQRLRAHRSSDFKNFSSSLASFLQYLEDTRRGNSESVHLLRPSLTNNQGSLYLDGVALSIRRRLAILEDGRPCLVPDKTWIGDWLAIVAGAPIPLVLRQFGEHFKIVGCCYIHDIMDGQAFQNGRNLVEFDTLVVR
jgi:hypothetical protein